MRGDKRALLLLLPFVGGLVYYNVSFFRARDKRAAPAAGPTAAPAAAKSAASPAAPAPLVVRSYREALALLSQAESPSLAAPARWSARDVFVPPPPPPSEAELIPPSPTPPAPQSAPAAAQAKAPPAPRVDGWVKTPRGEYAIIDGRLAGPALEGDGDDPEGGRPRVLRISRSGVVVQTAQGLEVLPLAGEPAERAAAELRGDPPERAPEESPRR